MRGSASLWRQALPPSPYPPPDDPEEQGPFLSDTPLVQPNSVDVKVRIAGDAVEVLP